MYCCFATNKMTPVIYCSPSHYRDNFCYYTSNVTMFIRFLSSIKPVSLETSLLTCQGHASVHIYPVQGNAVFENVCLEGGMCVHTHFCVYMLKCNVIHLKCSSSISCSYSLNLPFSFCCKEPDTF